MHKKIDTINFLISSSYFSPINIIYLFLKQRKDKNLLMPLASPDGIRPGAFVINTGEAMKIGVGNQLIGRVLDGLGRPIDTLGDIRFSEYRSTVSCYQNYVRR